MRLLAEPCDTIWKFPVLLQDDFLLTMPAGSVPLSVGVQRGEVFLWAAVNAHTEATEEHQFFLCGTGHPLGSAGFHRFVGTFQYGPLVFHLFDGGIRDGESA
jgi:hypothetical protein